MNILKKISDQIFCNIYFSIVSQLHTAFCHCALLQIWLLLVLFIWFQSCTVMTSRIGHILTLIGRVLKVEALCSSKMFVSTYNSAWHHKPEDDSWNIWCCHAWRSALHWCKYLLHIYSLLNCSNKTADELNIIKISLLFCHKMSWWMLTFYAVKLSWLGKWQKGHCISIIIIIPVKTCCGYQHRILPSVQRCSFWWVF
jgi:hypothetical protein